MAGAPIPESLPQPSLTMEDIARLCGVSRQTVHAALNDKPGVSASTRDRILEVVKKYNYQPNRIATTLLGKTTNLVGVTILNIRNPFFAELIQGINQVLREENLHIIFFETTSKEEEVEAIENLLSYQVAGIIVCPIQEESRTKHFEALTLRRLPFVSVGPIRGLDASYVEVEAREAGYLATNYLAGRGHRRICHLQGPKKIISAGERALGFVQALMERQIPFNDSSIAGGGETTREGYQAAREVLSRPAGERPTAIVCFNDVVAIGVYEAALELGLSIPGDLSIIGCDNIEITHLLAPPLTTIALPIMEMGRSAAEMLLSRIRTPQEAGAPTVRRFPPSLIERQSVASVPPGT